MRSLYTILFIFAIFTSRADGGVLEELSLRLKAMGSYGSKIAVVAQGERIEGHYRVGSQSNYHIDLGSVEIWGEGDKRYEVSHKMEEIVVERVEGQSSGVLLQNPAKAFDLAGQGFDVVTRGDDIVLTPQVGHSAVDVDRIVISLDSATGLPCRIVYEADDDRVEILFGGITQISGLEPFNRSKYRKYELVELF